MDAKIKNVGAGSMSSHLYKKRKGGAARTLRLLGFSLLIAFGFSAEQNVFSQNTLSSQLPDQTFANAANQWQLIAVDIKSQLDTVTPDERAQRNSYWKGPLEELRPPPNGASFSSEGVYLSDTPEFASPQVLLG